MSVKVRLRSICNVEGSKGLPGDEVTVSEELARNLIQGRGATLVSDNGQADQPPKPRRGRPPKNAS